MHVYVQGGSKIKPLSKTVIKSYLNRQLGYISLQF